MGHHLSPDIRKYQSHLKEPQNIKQTLLSFSDVAKRNDVDLERRLGALPPPGFGRMGSIDNNDEIP
jgi:hypothetical protein